MRRNYSIMKEWKKEMQSKIESNQLSPDEVYLFGKYLRILLWEFTNESVTQNVEILNICFSNIEF